MNKRMIGLVFFCVSLLCLSAFAALADDQSALVVDKAKIFGGKLSQVEQAVGKLQRTGADVHVWTIETFAGEASSLDGYFHKLLKKFPAWQSSSGGEKNNLLVLMIATKERKTGIYYGGEWSNPLGKNWLRIQTDFMNPKFRRGDFAEGFVAALDEISRVTHDYLHPTGKSQVMVVSGQPSQPTDFSGLWTAFKLAILLGFLCIVAFFVLRTSARRREEQERKNRAQQKAKIEKTAASKKLSEIKSGITGLEPLVAAVSALLHQEEGQKLKKKLDALKSKSAAVAEAFAATDSSAGDPTNPGFSEAQYEAIEDKFGKVNNQADEVVALAENLEGEVSSLRDLVTKAPQEAERLKKGIDDATAMVNKVKTKGFKVDAQNVLLQEAVALLEKLQNIINNKQYSDVPDAAKAVQTKYEEAKIGALALVECQEKMVKAKAGIQEDISGAEAKIAEAGEVLKKDESLTPQEAWQALTEAGQKMAVAKKELKQAEPDYILASESCQQAQALAEKAMMIERKRQADTAMAALRQQMRDNPRNISPEARRQIREIEASYSRADSGGLNNTDLLLLYMMINQQSHDTIIINQQHIESDTHFADQGYGSHGGYSSRGEESEREPSRGEEDRGGGGSSNWGSSEDGGGGGSSDMGGDSGGGDSGGGGSSDY